MHEQFCCTNVASKYFGFLAFTTVTYVLNGWCAILAYDGTVNSIFRYNSVVLCKLNKKIFTKKKKSGRKYIYILMSIVYK